MLRDPTSPSSDLRDTITDSRSVVQTYTLLDSVTTLPYVIAGTFLGSTKLPRLGAPEVVGD